MTLIEEIAEDPKFHLDMYFEIGELQFINNNHTLHSRTSWAVFGTPTIDPATALAGIATRYEARLDELEACLVDCSAGASRRAAVAAHIAPMIVSVYRAEQLPLAAASHYPVRHSAAEHL